MLELVGQGHWGMALAVMGQLVWALLEMVHLGLDFVVLV